MAWCGVAREAWVRAVAALDLVGVVCEFIHTAEPSPPETGFARQLTRLPTKSARLLTWTQHNTTMHALRTTPSLFSLRINATSSLSDSLTTSSPTPDISLLFSVRCVSVWVWSQHVMLSAHSPQVLAGRLCDWQEKIKDNSPSGSRSE